MLKYLRALTLIVLLSLTSITLHVHAANRTGESAPVPTVQNGVSYRFVNLIPDQNIDLYRNENAEYYNNRPGALTPERIITAGFHDFALYALNASPTGTEPLAELSVDLSGQTAMLLIAYEQDGAVYLMEHNYDLNPVMVNKARLELFNLAAAQPYVTVIAQNQDTLLESAYPGDVTAADIPGGVYQITLQDSDSGEALAQTSINTIPGNLVTVMLYGSRDLHLIRVDNALPVSGAIRFVNAGNPDLALDVYADTVPIATGLDYAIPTDYIGIDTGSHTFELYESGGVPGVDLPLWTGSLPISRNAPLTGVILGDDSPRLITYQDDLQSIPENKARMRVINAASTLTNLTVRDDSATPMVGGLGYVLGSPNQNIDAGSRTLTFRETGGADLVTLNNFEFLPNHFYTFIVISGALTDGSVDVLPLDWNWQQNADTFIE